MPGTVLGTLCLLGLTFSAREIGPIGLSTHLGFFVVVVVFPFFFFFFLAVLHSTGNFPNQESNPHPLHWKHGVLTTGSPGKSSPGFIKEEMSSQGLKWLPLLEILFVTFSAPAVLFMAPLRSRGPSHSFCQSIHPLFPSLSPHQPIFQILHPSSLGKDRCSGQSGRRRGG